MVKYPLLILAALTVPMAYGTRTFSIDLDWFKCTVNPIYAKPPKCFVNKTSSKPLGYLDVQMQRETPSMQFAFDFVLLRGKTERYMLVNSVNNDACSFIEGKFNLKALAIIRDTLMKAGSMPKKCPIEKDFNFLFKELSLDAEKFPPYFPEASFSILFNFSQGKDFVFSVEAMGKIVQKSKKRWG